MKKSFATVTPVYSYIDSVVCMCSVKKAIIGSKKQF